jgi:cytochrome c oxidase subunit I
MKLTSKPYNLFLLAALVCLFVTFFFGSQTIDFHIHDTVFIIAGLHIFLGLALLLSIFWLIYKVSYKILFSKTITWIHVTISLISAFLVIFLIYYMRSHDRGISNYDWTTFKQQQRLNIYIGVFILLFSLSQILFLFNILGGLVKHFTSKR